MPGTSDYRVSGTPVPEMTPQKTLRICRRTPWFQRYASKVKDTGSTREKDYP
jgi:hypothetical protein